MCSCLAMSPDGSYQEMRSLTKEKYSQNYKIAAAYVDRLRNGPPMRSEDRNALQKFSVLLTSCKSALKDIGYLNKLESLDVFKKVKERLLFWLKQKWHEVDDIIQLQNRDVTVEDIATFMEKRGWVVTKPIFRNMIRDSKNNNSANRKQIWKQHAQWVGRVQSLWLDCGMRFLKRPLIICYLWMVFNGKFLKTKIKCKRVKLRNTTL